MEPRKGGNGRHVIKENIFHGGAVTSTLTQTHKQGHLGDLREKSKVELLDLLERQQKILKNRQFVEKLPDQGEKVRKLATELQLLISGREVQVMESEVGTEDTHDNTEIPLEVQNTQPSMEESLKIIERGFGNLQVHEGPHYQVIVKAEERGKKKSKFSLNRNLKKDSPSPSSKQSQDTKEPDLTSASIHDPDHGPAKMISVGECRNLYSSQQKKMKELQAEQLQDRLLRRMGMVTPIEHPEGSLKIHEKVGDGNMNNNNLDSVD